MSFHFRFSLNSEPFIVGRNAGKISGAQVHDAFESVFAKAVNDMMRYLM
jgi:hypothetical protein